MIDVDLSSFGTPVIPVSKPAEDTEYLGKYKVFVDHVKAHSRTEGLTNWNVKFRHTTHEAEELDHKCIRAEVEYNNDLRQATFVWYTDYDGTSTYEDICWCAAHEVGHLMVASIEAVGRARSNETLLDTLSEEFANRFASARCRDFDDAY